MKSNYRKIGECIRLVDERNTDLKVTNLIGISITKEVIPSVANTVGTDMSKYKIIRKNQFACSTMQVRRDKKMPVALLREVEEAIISPAYPVFEVIDESIILAEYLMMWFSRAEFDREACFYAIGGVRGSIEWEDFCNMQLPVPSVKKQTEIVKEYKVLEDRISLNNRKIEKLEATAQTVYKQWFVDFDFPDKDGNPYKSSNGEMKFNGDIDREIPMSWEVGSLDKLADIIDGDRGRNYPSKEEMTDKGYCLFLNASNVSRRGFNFTKNVFISKEKDNALRKGKLVRNDVVITSRGTVGNIGYYSDIIRFNNIRINSGMVILRNCEYVENTIFLYSMLRSIEMKRSIQNFISGSAQPQLPIKDLIKIPIVIPEREIILLFSELAIKIQNRIDTINVQNNKLDNFIEILLSKLATMGGKP